MDRVEVAHQVARRVDEEVRHHGVVRRRFLLKNGGEVALDEEDRAGAGGHVRDGDGAEHGGRGAVVGPRVDEGVEDGGVGAGVVGEEAVGEVLIGGPFVVRDVEAWEAEGVYQQGG